MLMNKRIYLVGYMGAGKSTVARRLARHLGWTSLDIDDMFEERYHITVDHFFERFGEDLFRVMETELLYSTEKMENVVISTGGGTPCFNDNMRWMNDKGLTVFIMLSEQSLLHRLLHSKRKRPLVMGKSENELEEYIKVHYDSRRQYYNQAAITVKGENLDYDSLLAQLSDLY